MISQKEPKVNLKNNTQNILFFALLIACLVFSSYYKVSKAAVTATLNLSPTSGTVGLNQTFTVNLSLDTAGNAVDGVDVFSIHFNPTILQVVDDNSSLTGIQITPGTLMPATTANIVDNTTGTIQFSQASSGGSNFTGSGILATIHFKGIAGGNSAVTIDAIQGSTSDSNVAFQGNDLLSSVTNGNYTVDITDSIPPTVSMTAPTSLATVSGSGVTVSATASDNVAVSGVQFKLDGVNLGSEDTTSPYSITWNTTSATEGNHSLTAVARDAAGNQNTSSAVSVVVANTFQRTIQIDPEARPTKVMSGTLNVLNTSKTLIKSFPFTTNTSGQATITFDISPQTVFLKLNLIPFLTRIISLDLTTNTTYIFPKLLIGDIVQDNIINSVDYSSLNSKWFTSDPATDLNKDNIVNSIDFSYMNQHWLVTGDN